MFCYWLEGMNINKVYKWLAMVLFFGAVYLAYTPEITGNYSTKILGRLDMQSDVPVFYNNIYHFEKKVSAGQNPLKNDMEMHPVGVNMLMNSHNMVMGLFCLPFKNNMLGVNIGLLLSFILSGLGAAILCYRFTPNIWLAALVGFVFAFSPWKMIKLQDHFWFALTATIPFYIYHFIDVFRFREKRWLPTIASYKKLMYCLLLGFITALSEYYLTFFLIYFSLFYVLFRQYVQPWNFNFRAVKTWLIVAASVAGISVLVAYLDGIGFDNKGAFFWGGDILAYFLPVYKQWVKDGLELLGMEIPAYQENFFFLGFSFLAFSVVVFFLAKKQKISPSIEVKTFAWLALVFMLFSLPILKVAGHFFFYLPTAILHYVPFFNNVRVITRIFVLFSLVFPIVVVWFYHHTASFKYKNAIPIIVLLLLLVEFKAPHYDVIDKKQIPGEVYAVKEMAGDVVLPMPVGIRDGFNQIGTNNSDMLVYQTVFDKKMIGGYTARITGDVEKRYTEDVVMNQLMKLSEDRRADYTLPSTYEVNKFYKMFNPDIILMDATYTETKAEEFIRTLVEKGEQVGYKTKIVIYSKK